MSIIENVMSAAYSRTSANWFQIIARTSGFWKEEQRIRQLFKRGDDNVGWWAECVEDGVRAVHPSRLHARGRSPNDIEGI